MVDRVELALRRAARSLLEPGTRLLVAVSGGADSIALVHLLAVCRPVDDLELVVAHLDHGLRAGSRRDRRFVERTAAGLGIPCIAERREVARLRRSDESPEEAARRVRRAFLLDARRACGADLVATGHTLDDQAETILMRLARGAGPSAVLGMSAAGPGPFIRPLLEIARAELRSWLERRALAWREDATNRDLRFDRNRVRRLVVPRLAEALNPRAAEHLVRAAARIREDSALLDAIAERHFRAVARRRAGALRIEAPALAALAIPLGGRVARLALARAGVDPRRIGERHVRALLDLARDGGRGELHLPGRLLARRVSPRAIRIERPDLLDSGDATVEPDSDR